MMDKCVYNSLPDNSRSLMEMLILQGYDADLMESRWMSDPNPMWENKSPQDIINEGQEEFIFKFLRSRKGKLHHAYC